MGSFEHWNAEYAMTPRRHDGHHTMQLIKASSMITDKAICLIFRLNSRSYASFRFFAKITAFMSSDMLACVLPLSDSSSGSGKCVVITLREASYAF
jgi:hypothetical protein